MGNLIISQGAIVTDKRNLASIDYRYGPYATVQTAHAALSADGLNAVGLTVGIKPTGSNTITEYWYQGGTGVNNLVEKGGGDKDKEYNPSDYSGIGKRYVNKNIQIDAIPFDGFTSFDGEYSDVLDNEPDAILWSIVYGKFLAKYNDVFYEKWPNRQDYINLSNDSTFICDGSYYRYVSAIQPNVPYLDEISAPISLNIATQSMFNADHTTYVIQNDFKIGKVVNVELAFSSMGDYQVRVPSTWPIQNAASTYFYCTSVTIEAGHALHLCDYAVRLDPENKTPSYGSSVPTINTPGTIPTNDGIIYAGDEDITVDIGCIAGTHTFRYDKYIVIPTDCTLEFDGGSIKDGTINCESDVKIISAKKCFDNIAFGGQFRYSGVVKLDWFVEKYANNVDDTTVDNTAAVQYVMSLGVRNVEFPTDKFIRLTDAVTVTTATNILASADTNRFQEAFAANAGNLRQPCVFKKSTDKDASPTLFDYRIKNFVENNAYPFTIGAITLYVDIPYEDYGNTETSGENKKEWPVLNIESNWGDTGAMYGVNLDCNIVSQRHSMTIIDDNEQEHTDALNNYTGINIFARKGPITYIKIKGNIFGTYYGVITDHDLDPSNLIKHWLTDIEVSGNTWCCIGGDFRWGQPAIIYGSHQTAPVDTINIYNKLATKIGYFSGNSVYLYGKIWDCGQDSNRGYFVTATLPVKKSERSDATESQNTDFIINSYNDRSMPRVYSYGKMVTVYNNPIENAPFNFVNVLRIVKDTNYSYGSPIYQLKYRFNYLDAVDTGVNILSTNVLSEDPVQKVWNSDNLFNDDNIALFGGLDALQHSHACYCDTSLDANKKCIISFIIDRALLISSKGSGNIPMLLYRKFTDGDAKYTSTIKIETSNKAFTDDAVIASTTTFTVNSSIYATRTTTINLRDAIPNFKDDTSAYIKVTIEIAYRDGNTSIPTFFTLPTVIIPSYFPMIYNPCFTSEALRPNIVDNTRKGLSGFDQDLSKPIVWDRHRWLDANGFSAMLTKGTTANRPALVNVDSTNYHHDDIGFRYFDTTLNRLIIAKNVVSGADPEEVVLESSVLTNGLYIANPFNEGDVLHLVTGTLSNGYIQIYALDSNFDYDPVNPWKKSHGGDNTYICTVPKNKYPYLFIKDSSGSSKATGVRISKATRVKWVEQDGASAGTQRSGLFAERPLAEDIYVGFKYFATDIQTAEGETDGIEIIHKGDNIWVDALGRVLAYGVTANLVNLYSGIRGTINKGANLEAYINPMEGYENPSTITVEMGGTTLTAGTDYDLTPITNVGLRIRIPKEGGSGSVTGNVVITASGVAAT